MKYNYHYHHHPSTRDRNQELKDKLADLKTRKHTLSDFELDFSVNQLSQNFGVKKSMIYGMLSQ